MTTQRYSPTRRLWMGSLAAAAVLAACKRQRAPDVAEIWDEDPAPGEAEALANLAPPWPSPTKVMLDNGLLSFWLHEPAGVVAHVRVLLATTARAEPIDAGAASVVTQTLRSAFHRRLGRHGIEVHIDNGPGRAELVLHGAEDRLPMMLGAIAQMLGGSAKAARAALVATQANLSRAGARFESETAATALVVSRMLGLPPAASYADPAGLRSRSEATVLEAYDALTDPRSSVLVVHAGRPAAQAATALRQLATAWAAPGRSRGLDQATARMQVVGLGPRSGRLLADPSAPLNVIPIESDASPTLAFGRVIATPTTAERAMARLSQRVLQEEIDARLVISGKTSALVVVASLSSRDPDGDAQAAVDALKALAVARHPRQRLFQAAQLWLGARVVQASLSGEDWTALFSTAIDLATSDDEVPAALARDAKAMLAIDSPGLMRWQAQWLDPSGGQAGWHWAVAGADAKVRRRLERLGPLKTVALAPTFTGDGS